MLYICDFVGNMGYFLRGEWYHMHDGYVNYIITWKYDQTSNCLTVFYNITWYG